MLKLLLFDLDGTLVDTLPDIAAAVNHALGRHGFPAVSRDQVRQGIGDGAEQLVSRCLRAGGTGSAPSPAVATHGEDGEIRRRVLDSFLAYYTENCSRLSRPFPGVPEMLGSLADRTLGVLTNKPLASTRKILADLRLEDFFFHIVGGDGPWGKKPAPEGLRHLRASAAAASQETLLVGDGWQDYQVARNDEVEFLLFEGGYGSSSPLLAGHPHRFATFAELPCLIETRFGDILHGGEKV